MPIYSTGRSGVFMQNYGKLLTPYINKEDNLTIVDISEIIKSYSEKLEVLSNLSINFEGTN